MIPLGKKRVPVLLALSLFFHLAFSQTTLNDKNSSSPSGTKSNIKHKVLLIPFNNKMYMSEIDHVIYNETKKNQKEIRWSFQDKIDQVLYNKFKSKYEVKSLIEDTVKNSESLKMVFSGVGFRFDKVPDQKNYTAPKSDYKRDGKITNGQITANPDHSARFMNAKLQDKQLLQKLNKKFQTDVFIFINQLDIKSSSNSSSGSFGAEKLRNAVIHYTVFDVQGREINSGIAQCNFPKNQNDPDLITVNYIEKALQEIYVRVDKALNPSSIVTGK